MLEGFQRMPEQSFMNTQEYSKIFNDPFWMNEALRAGNTGLWKITIDPTGKEKPLMFANDTMLLLLGLENHPEPDICFEHWYSRINEAYHTKVQTAVERLTSQEEHTEVEYPWLHPSRGQIYVRCGGRLVPTNDGKKHLMGYHQDITELQTTRQSLEESLARLALAHRDALTGLLTRRIFFDNAERELLAAMRHGWTVAFIMMDIDFFKNVNDTYGHLVGDGVLQECARRLQTKLRTIDLSGRYGGEEFSVLLPGTTLNQAVIVAERIRKYCAQYPIIIEDYKISITVSLGVSTMEPADLQKTTNIQKSLEEMIDRADKAMYQAKRNGRNRTCTASLIDEPPYLSFECSCDE